MDAYELLEAAALSGQMTQAQLQSHFAADPEFKAWFEARVAERDASRQPKPLSEIIFERDFYKQACEKAHEIRDSLTRRCADQARQIGVLMLQDGRRLTVSTEEVINALRARADEDGCIHFDAIREILKRQGARP